jgi:hypothetical protein
MNIEKLRELEKVIYNIYYSGENPEKFKELTFIEDYMEELYPSDKNKLFGDFITENFDIKSFLQTDKINQEIKTFSELYNKVLYYANLPNGKTTKQLFSEYNSIIEQNPDISSITEDI